MCVPSARGAAAAAASWMSLPGDPEDCSECVSVSLINSNTGAFGTCGQVNETQWESTSPWFPPRHEAAGDRMRFSNSRCLSPSAPPPPPLPTYGTVWYPLYAPKAPPPSRLFLTATYGWILPSQVSLRKVPHDVHFQIIIFHPTLQWIDLTWHPPPKHSGDSRIHHI